MGEAVAILLASAAFAALAHITSPMRIVGAMVAPLIPMWGLGSYVTYLYSAWPQFWLGQALAIALIVLPYGWAWSRYGVTELAEQRKRYGLTARSAPSGLPASALALAPTPVLAPALPGGTLIDRVLSRPARIESISEGGVVRIRITGWAARLLITYRLLQIGFFLAIFALHDTILEYVGSQVAANITPIIRGMVFG